MTTSWKCAVTHDRPAAMRLDEYRAAAASTAIYPGAGDATLLGLSYLALGLAGEVSEVAHLVRAHYDGGVVALADIRLELGDVLWYDAMLTHELRIPATDPHGDTNSDTNSDSDPIMAPSVMTSLLGLVVASGAVAEVVKKSIRGGTDVPFEKIAAALVKVRAHVAVIALRTGLTVEEIRAANIAKLANRYATDTIKVHG